MIGGRDLHTDVYKPGRDSDMRRTIVHSVAQYELEEFPRGVPIDAFVTEVARHVITFIYSTRSIHYTKVIFVRPSVRDPSVCQRKRFDPETQEAVSLAIERTKLELGDHYEQQ